MNTELMEALDALEREKGIAKEVLFKAIEDSLLTACKNHFGKADNVKVEIDRETGDYLVYAAKEVVKTPEEVEDDMLQIALDDAKKLAKSVKVGDVLNVEIKSKEFGRIATMSAKNVILQKIREEERNVIYNQYFEKEKMVVTGVVQRYIGKNVSINLGKADAMLNESEMVKGEEFKPTERIKVYVLDVKNTPKGPRINVSRTHPELVRKLFESEVSEISDGIVEIRSIAREAGSRTKIAVWSNNPNVDPVGACVGMNGSRVNAIVDELGGEKIDIVNWDENPGTLVQNALSPASVVAVFADPDEKTAKVVVPDDQLSLAIGKEGQNARLAAKLTGYKIDIKSETQAKDSPGFRYEDYMYDEDEFYDEEGYEGEYEGDVILDDEAEAPADGE
jgi:N utilization substance protein A